MEWGTVGEWASAAATVAVFVLGFRVLRRQGDLIKRQLEDLERSAQDRRRDQASKVSAWVEYLPDPQGGGLHPVSHVRNVSSSPVYACRLQLTTNPGFEPSSDAYHWFRTIPPEETVDWSMAGESRPLLLDYIHFTDDRGVNWVRSGGQLTEVREPAYSPC